MLSKKEKEVEEFYTNISADYETRHNKRFCDDILEYFLLKFLPKQKLKILDVGGGIGRFAIPLAKRGHLVTLSDVSQGMLDKAKEISSKEKIKIKFVRESLIDLKTQKDKSFDAVLVMNAVLDYCSNYNKALKEVHRVLKPKGLLIGSVNNRFVYASSHELKDGDFDLFRKSMRTGNRYIIWGGMKSGHWTHEFTLKELRESLKKHQFNISKILGVFNLLGKYIDISSYDQKQLKELLKLQIEYAQKEEYVNNSSDYFFVAEKKALFK